MKRVRNENKCLQGASLPLVGHIIKAIYTDKLHRLKHDSKEHFGIKVVTGEVMPNEYDPHLPYSLIGRQLVMRLKNPKTGAITDVPFSRNTSECIYLKLKQF
jgi:hypothetical protein